jgi:MFS transporter, ACS family, glucarate transporter
MNLVDGTACNSDAESRGTPSTQGRTGMYLKPSRARHVVLALTVAAYMITYMDRVSIAVAVPAIQKDLGLSMITVGWVFSSFRWGYALFQIPGGWLGDRIGPRRGLTLIVAWWSVFTSATALVWSAPSLMLSRFLFGVGEAGAFPIATRSLARWMPSSERGFAQGIAHAGSRLGAALTPGIVVLLIIAYGWRAPFLAFGALGLIWAAVWYWYYRDAPAGHPGVNAAELRLIEESKAERSAAGPGGVPWRHILRSRHVWTLSLMYLCYGYCIDVYLDWFPKYLHDQRNFDLKQMGFYASLPLLAGTAGDLLGGWCSDRWARLSGNLKAARRGVAVSGFLLAAAAILPATFATSGTTSVYFSCLAVFGLELTVGVSWAVPIDIGGNYAGSVAAVMNTFGNIGSAVSPALLAYLVGLHGWNVPFVASSVLCLVAAVLFSRIDASCRIFAS